MRVLYIFIFTFTFCFLKAQYILPENGIVFTNEEVPRIDILIDTFYLNLILHQDSLDSNTEYPATFIFSSSKALDTIHNVGFRLRGNTSRKAHKKSFKVAFDSFDSEKQYYGLQKLNLNGEHNDPSIIRSKFCWDLYAKMSVPSSRANHVRLYINNEYRGLYINVEHVDEKFLEMRMSDPTGNLWKCLWPADLHYLGADPDIYANAEFGGRKIYALKTNKTENDFSKLSQFIHILNNLDGTEFECAIQKAFDVESYLKIIALDILVGNWDGPIINKNNFYLYHDPTTDRISYLPYDLDNTMGIDWFGVAWENTPIYSWSDLSGQYRPLYEEIMAVPAFRDRFSFYMDSLLNHYFTPPISYSYLDNKRDQIQEFREDDDYAALDYGYSFEDFLSSYEIGLWGHAKIGLKDYIYKRHLTANNQLQLNPIQPFINWFFLDWSEHEILFHFNVQAFSANTSVYFYYQINDEVWEITPLTLNPNGDVSFNFPVTTTGFMNYYIAIQDGNGDVSNYPSCQDGYVKLGYDPTHHLVINEFMASNSTKKADEFGEYDDWIELYNISDQTIPLFDYYITDDPDKPNKFKLPNTVLGSGEYLIIWADNDSDQGPNHANFKLKKEG